MDSLAELLSAQRRDYLELVRVQCQEWNLAVAAIQRREGAAAAGATIDDTKACNPAADRGTSWEASSRRAGENGAQIKSAAYESTAISTMTTTEIVRDCAHVQDVETSDTIGTHPALSADSSAADAQRVEDATGMASAGSGEMATGREVESYDINSSAQSQFTDECSPAVEEMYDTADCYNPYVHGERPAEPPREREPLPSLPAEGPARDNDADVHMAAVDEGFEQVRPRSIRKMASAFTEEEIQRAVESPALTNQQISMLCSVRDSKSDELRNETDTATIEEIQGTISSMNRLINLEFLARKERPARARARATRRHT